MLKNAAIVEKINFCVLIAGIIILIALFPNKRLNYDEPFSIMCSKGITNLSVGNLRNSGTVTSADINAQNTYHNVFQGGDSFYYVGLHYFTPLFNNSLASYVAYSIIWSILALIAFYWLCRTVLGSTLFTSLAIVMFFTDIQVMNTTFLVRPYTMTLCLVLLSAIYFFKYLTQRKSPTNLLLLGLFGVCSILTHYFAVYVVIGYALVLLYTDRLTLLTPKKLLAIFVPVALLGLYFITHRSLNSSYSSYQGYAKNGLHLKMLVSVWQANTLFTKSIALNFRAIYPLFKDTLAVNICSFLLVIFIYIYGSKKVIVDKEERRKYHLLFLMGISSSVFLGILCYAINNTMLFTYRYFLFSFPFCCIFIVLFVCSLAENRQINIALKGILIIAIIGPVFLKLAKKGFENTGFQCNHFEVAKTIVKDNVHETEVPGLVDAVFINCLLPTGYTMTYHINAKSNNFTLHKPGGNEQIPAINSEVLALF